MAFEFSQKGQTVWENVLITGVMLSILNMTSFIDGCLRGDWLGVSKTTNASTIFPSFAVFQWVVIIRWDVVDDAMGVGWCFMNFFANSTSDGSSGIIADITWSISLALMHTLLYFNSI